MFGKNTKYQIKTKNGYEDFLGIRVKDNCKTFCVVLESGIKLDCTMNHKLLTPFGWSELSYLYEGDVVETINGNEKIIKILPNIITERVYDVVDAGKDHSYYTNNIHSHNCEFIGSTNTLINPAKLRSLSFKTPTYQEPHYQEYVAPEEGKTYCLSVDVARGQGLDYSAFSVIDVSQIPYVQVAKYKCNTITPLLYPTIIFNIAKKYNEAFILVEINDIGQQVADILHHELAYENLLKIATRGRAGQQVTPGFKPKMQLGIKTSVQVKRIGCANLKTLVENDKLLIHDADTIMELTTFSADRQSFAAEEGNNDDLAMTLVLFGWLASQRYFKESVMNDIRTTLQQEQLNIMDQDLVPFGIIDDGLKDDFEIDRNGDIWTEAKKLYPFDDWNWEPKL